MAAQSTALVINLDQLGKTTSKWSAAKMPHLVRWLAIFLIWASVFQAALPPHQMPSTVFDRNRLTRQNQQRTKTLDVDDVKKLNWNWVKKDPYWIIEQELPNHLEQEVRQSFETMSGGEDIAVAVVLLPLPKICQMPHSPVSKKRSKHSRHW